MPNFVPTPQPAPHTSARSEQVMTAKETYKRTQEARLKMCSQLAQIAVKAEAEENARKTAGGIKIEAEPLFEAITVIEAFLSPEARKEAYTSVEEIDEAGEDGPQAPAATSSAAASSSTAGMSMFEKARAKAAEKAAQAKEAMEKAKEMANVSLPPSPPGSPPSSPLHSPPHSPPCSPLPLPRASLLDNFQTFELEALLGPKLSPARSPPLSRPPSPPPGPPDQPAGSVVLTPEQAKQGILDRKAEEAAAKAAKKEADADLKKAKKPEKEAAKAVVRLNSCLQQRMNRASTPPILTARTVGVASVIGR